MLLGYVTVHHQLCVQLYWQIHVRVLVSGRVRFRQGLLKADLGGRERGVRGGEYGADRRLDGREPEGGLAGGLALTQHGPTGL